MTAHEEITARLLLGGVAGPHCSHSREDNVLKASQLASGDPDATFGMADLASATTEEGLHAVQAITGAREPGQAYIDPDATIAGVRIYRYLQGVGAVTDGVRGLHTHSPLPMEQVLEAGERPELVFADHGFAGAALSRGIPVVACMDTNDTALAVARARGRDITLIPLDDGRRPDAYDVIAEMFEQELGTGVLST